MDNKLASEKVVISAPFSYHGSAARIWKITNGSSNAAWGVILKLLAVILIGVAWMLVTWWYLVFGILVVPYRLIRRGSRKRKMESLRHRELLTAINKERKV